MTKKQSNELATKEYWNGIWHDIKLPVIIDLRNPIRKKFHKLFTELLPKSPMIKFLEIGCAPGAWLVYFNTYFKYKIYGLDYSWIGCIKTKENLEKCNVDGEIICADIFNSPLKEKIFDVVFSYGLIEHFTDTEKVIKEHIKLLKNGGILIIVIPNMGGFIGTIQKFCSRKIYYQHKILYPNYLIKILKNYGIKIIKCGYFGSFNLNVVNWKCRGGKIFHLLAKILTRVVLLILDLLNIEVESKAFSPYIIVIGIKSG